MIKSANRKGIYIGCTQALNARVSLRKSNTELSKIGNFIYQNTFMNTGKETLKCQYTSTTHYSK